MPEGSDAVVMARVDTPAAMMIVCALLTVCWEQSVVRVWKL